MKLTSELLREAAALLSPTNDSPYTYMCMAVVGAATNCGGKIWDRNSAHSQMRELLEDHGVATSGLLFYTSANGNRFSTINWPVEKRQELRFDFLNLLALEMEDSE